MNSNLQKELTLWETVKKEWYLFVIMLVPLAIALYFYPELPAKLPTHWGISGNIDGYSSKAFAVWFFPLLNLGIYFLLVLAPKIDPRRENYIRFSGAYRVIRGFLAVFFAAISLMTILTGLGYPIKVDLLIKLGISLMFIIIGNVMGKFRHNYFVGIKSPWTLASEEVWQKTHRFAGRLWVGAGVIGILLSFIGTVWASYLLFIMILVIAFAPIVMSYVYYRQIKR